jgi:hypothetical protein
MSSPILPWSQYHLGGVMYWEESQDPEERLLAVLHESLAPPPSIGRTTALTKK